MKKSAAARPSQCAARKGIPPAAPDSREQHPEESVGSSEPKPSRRGLLEDRELVAEGQDLRFEVGASSEAEPNRRKERRDARPHDRLDGIRSDR